MTTPQTSLSINAIERSLLIYQLPAIEPIETLYRVSEVVADECKAYVCFQDAKFLIYRRQAALEKKGETVCTVVLLLTDTRLVSHPYTFTIQVTSADAGVCTSTSDIASFGSCDQTTAEAFTQDNAKANRVD